MFNGFPVIDCKGWWGHVLNALDLKLSLNQHSKRSLLLSVGVNGILSGSSGTTVLRGHPHDAFALRVAEMLLSGTWFGKPWCIKPRSLRADADR